MEIIIHNSNLFSPNFLVLHPTPLVLIYSKFKARFNDENYDHKGS
jgi:hypothetical protein